MTGSEVIRKKRHPEGEEQANPDHSNSYQWTLVSVLLYSYQIVRAACATPALAALTLRSAKCDPQVTSVTFEFFNCFDVGGRRLMVSNPVIDCDSHEYSTIRPVFLVFIIVRGSAASNSAIMAQC